MSSARFATRDQLAGSEWDNQRRDWKRPAVDKEVLRQLSRRSTLNGLLRLAWFLLLLAVPGAATVYVSRIDPWLAIPCLYVYWFIYGFWIALAHELQHKTVFGPGADWFSDILHFMTQAIIWGSPTHGRVSHRLHHRYTMVRGVDAETEWPEVITTRWLRGMPCGTSPASSWSGLSSSWSCPPRPSAPGPWASRTA